MLRRCVREIADARYLARGTLGRVLANTALPLWPMPGSGSRDDGGDDGDEGQVDALWPHAARWEVVVDVPIAEISSDEFRMAMGSRSNPGDVRLSFPALTPVIHM
jgi:hypothetical protein